MITYSRTMTFLLLYSFKKFFIVVDYQFINRLFYYAEFRSFFFINVRYIFTYSLIANIIYVYHSHIYHSHTSLYSQCHISPAVSTLLFKYLCAVTCGGPYLLLRCAFL